MSENKNTITISELKAYLYSLENEREVEKEEKVNEYKLKCEENKKKPKSKDIQKIKNNINKKYQNKIDSKNEIMELLEECKNIPSNIEKLEIVKYLMYRADIKKAENVLTKAIKRLGNRYNGIIDIIEEDLDDFEELDEVEEVDYTEYRADGKALEDTKLKYKMTYTEEEKKSLVQRELEIVQKSKVFNTTPIPHEILKTSDKDIQSKMQRFNRMRQKRLRIIDTMEADYLRLVEPRHAENLINDAQQKITDISEILTKSEYVSIERSIAKKKKKVYRSTSDLREVIKTKEKKTGIINYGIQEARYVRMESLRLIISDATNIIKKYEMPGAEEQLAKLKSSYEREKQFAAVIEKLQEGTKDSENTEVKAFEEQIAGLEKSISNAKKITKEEEEKIAKAKKELLILWKIEMESTISNKKESVALLEETNEDRTNEDNEINTKEKKKVLSLFTKAKKIKNGKHACA